MGRLKKENKFKYERNELANQITGYFAYLSNYLSKPSKEKKILTWEERKTVNNLLEKLYEFSVSIRNENIQKYTTTKLIQVEIIKHGKYYSQRHEKEYDSIIVNDNEKLPTIIYTLKKKEKRIIFANEEIRDFYFYHELNDSTFDEITIPLIKPQDDNNYWLYRIYLELEDEEKVLELFGMPRISYCKM